MFLSKPKIKSCGSATTAETRPAFFHSCCWFTLWFTGFCKKSSVTVKAVVLFFVCLFVLFFAMILSEPPIVDSLFAQGKCDF